MKKGSQVLDKRLGEAIRSMRLQKGLSLAALGKMVDLTFQQIQKYERGVSRISVNMLVEIAGVLEVDVRVFFDEIVGRRAFRASSAVVHKDDPDPIAKDVTSYRDAMVLSAGFLAIKEERIRKTIVQLVQAISDVRSDTSKPE